MNNDGDFELDDFDTLGTTIMDTNTNLEDGQNKCEKCGSTEISINPNNGNLRCHFCRHEQVPTRAEKFVTDISQLEGQVIGSGAGDIIADVADQLTFKCSSCAAEVVIDTSEAQQARCHWCRNTLSVNQQIPNGAVPDKVLPFSVKRADAVRAIENFVGNRKFFALKTFKAEFTTENVMGVYLPYMVIDVNSHASFDGEAEHVVNIYREVKWNIERTFQDVDTYRIVRDFDLIVEDLTVEASTEKLQHRSSQRTNNIINAIQPFDTDNSVTWNANYMTGFTSQKRDVNVEELSSLVQAKANDIATDVVMTQTMTSKSRGVRWLRKDMAFKGKQWRSAYLPVWIYSYQQEKSGDRKQLHYVAVNGRNQKAMGSVPLDMKKLIIFSLLLAILFILPGVIFFFVMKSRYRNAGATHDYVRQTTRNMKNLVSNDTLIRQNRGILVSERRLDDPRNSNLNHNRSTSVGTGAAAGATIAASQAVRGRNTSVQTTQNRSTSVGNSKVNKVNTNTPNTSKVGVSKQAKSNAMASKARASTPTPRPAAQKTSKTSPSSSRTSSPSRSSSVGSSSRSREASSSSRSTSTRSSSSSSSSSRGRR